MICRGIRGAITVEANDRELILEATRKLLALIIRLNGIQPKDIASVIFTTSPDLNAEYPALAARQLGWWDAPLLCGHEMSVPHGLPLCIRILIHWNTERDPEKIHHVYLEKATALRPDKAKLPPIDESELESWIHQQLSLWDDRNRRLDQSGA
ncbi:MAG: chorismate mutase [Verrucomicrobiota bacterium]|jgi:chorismate mutase|nr:chorismate mutase [Verrucomicrobiota bacterium]MDD8047347.1 chorismate mutase [Verrucomicrobiota bacterium]MDD8050271.1 chorismate mutase [Verrucomicrobiota bacterium]MDI9384960.1 chorismate mutase [Verrucomicrobiota bacterium]